MFEDFYMPQFDADYFNSPAFQQAIAAAVQQYSPAPVEPVYYAPEPVYYAPPPAPEITAGIGGIPQYMVEDYGLIGGAPDRFTAPQISAEQLAAERYAADQAAQQMEAQRAAAERYAAEQAAAQQAEAQRVAAEQAAAAAEAQRVAAAQELAARVEAERVAAERAAAAEAAAQRQQTELNERRAQAAQAAAERAAQERAFAEQAAAQAAAEAQAAAQAQAEAAAQAEAQRVAAAQAQAEAQAQAQAAEQARVQAEAAAAVTPAPEPVFTPEPQLLSGIGRAVDENYYVPEVQAPEQTYTPAPVAAPEADVVRGIGGREVSAEPDYGFVPEQIYAADPTPAPVYTPAVEPMTIEAEPVAGIGSPVVAAAEATPSVIETAAAAPAPAPASDTGLQVINANDYSPSETDLQTMGMSRDQWNEMMASLATLDLGNLNFGNFGVTNPDYTNNFRTFTAPKSNKGNPTSTVAKKDNTFNVIENQPIRLVDMSTGKVVFQGTGYDAAQKAIELAAGLTKAGGNKADWEIQTGQFKNPGSGDLQFGDSFKTVANEKKNTSILNQALDILGDAALGFIIGGPVGAAIAAGASAAGVNVSDIAYPIIATAVLGPVGFAGTAGAAALGSAVSSAVQGRSIEETLIRAGVTGLTAGVMSGTPTPSVGQIDVGGTVSDAVNNVLADLGFESQVGNILAGIGGSGTVDAVTGEIIVSATSKAVEKALEELAVTTISGAINSIASDAIIDAVQQVVPDYQPSPETEALLNQVDEAATTAAEIAADPTIVVTANPVSTVLSGTNPIVETAAGIAGGFSNVGDLVDSPELRDRIAEEKARVEEPKEEIVVEATRPVEPPPAEPVPEVAGIGGAVEPIVVTATKPPEPAPEEPAPEVAGIGGAIEPIVVTATKPPEPAPEEPAPEVAGIGGALEPIVVTATKPVEAPEAVTKEDGLPEGSVLAQLPLIDIPTPDPELTDQKSTFEKVKDAAGVVADVAPIIGGVLGGSGDGDVTPLVAKGGTYDVNPSRSDTFGTRGLANINFDPFTYGQATGDQPGEFMFFTRNPLTGAAAPIMTPAPITTPIVSEPAAPAGYVPSDNTYAEGGEINDDMAAHLMAYHKNGGHTGPGQVKGIGSGQEDKIPAWLSDGEYVWSAQDVADLGDGSTDEGVRRLDKMRKMVRRRAGRKDVKKIAKPQRGIDHMLKAVGGSN